MQTGHDVYVLYIIIGIVSIWLFYRFRLWLRAPLKIQVLLSKGERHPKGEAVALLEEAGYEVLSAKIRVPIDLFVDGKPLESRYFIDYLAKMDGRFYIVKLAKQRQPMEWTGTAVRDRLMPFYLLFRDTSGVVYVDLEEQKVKQITFEIHY